jgi:hypothetical protein
MRPEIRSLDHAYNSTGEDNYYYYAKGIGIIYIVKYDLGRVQSEWRIKEWVTSPEIAIHSKMSLWQSTNMF